ncbi:hypothetical protein GOP47_0006785, partial [Adiantum capillus-veneris]
PVSTLDDQLPHVGAMLLVDVLLKVVLQMPLCRLLQDILFEDNDDMASSLAVGGETCDAKVFRDVQACVERGDGSCMQFFEGLCCQDLQEELAYKFTSATLGWFVSILQMDGDDQCHIIYPGGVYTMLGMTFHLTQAGVRAGSESLSIYLLLHINTIYQLLIMQCYFT